MSETVAHKGKLIPLLPATERNAESVCGIKDYKLGEYASWLECLMYEGYEEYHIHGNTIYQVLDHEIDPNGFATSQRNSDGTIDYVILYYTGGVSFGEMLDEALDK